MAFTFLRHVRILLLTIVVLVIAACSDQTTQATAPPESIATPTASAQASVASSTTPTPNDGASATGSPGDDAERGTPSTDADQPDDDAAGDDAAGDRPGDDPSTDGDRQPGDDSGSADDGQDGDDGGSDGDDGEAGDDGASDGDDGDDGARITARLERGDSGDQVTRLQQRLRDLHYWVGTVDGVYGQLTEQAVYAFQGVEGLAVDGIVGPDTRAALADAGPPTPRSDSGDLIEVDEQAQVVMDVRDGAVRWTWHTSTGTNERYQHPAGHTALAETPDGRHTIGWQVDGWRRNELGRLWRPKYFHPDGIALHGFAAVPSTPSSHGCVRLTREAMDYIWEHDIAPEGSTVLVYGRAP